MGGVKVQAFGVAASVACAVWIAVGGAKAMSVVREPPHPERYALADRGPDVPLSETEWAQVHEEGLAELVLRVGCARKATPPPHPTVGCPWLPGLETPRAPRRHDSWSTPLAEAVESLRGVHDGGTPNRAVMFWRHRVFALVADVLVNRHPLPAQYHVWAALWHIDLRPLTGPEGLEGLLRHIAAEGPDESLRSELLRLRVVMERNTEAWWVLRLWELGPAAADEALRWHVEGALPPSRFDVVSLRFVVVALVLHGHPALDSVLDEVTTRWGPRASERLESQGWQARYMAGVGVFRRERLALQAARAFEAGSDRSDDGADQ